MKKDTLAENSSLFLIYGSQANSFPEEVDYGDWEILTYQGTQKSPEEQRQLLRIVYRYSLGLKSTEVSLYQNGCLLCL